MEQKPRSPRILHLSWGRLEVEGQDRPFKDAKLFPGGSRAWNWNETGTRHVPGIQPADVEELLEHGATVVVLSRGIYEQLQVCPQTLRLLQARNIPTCAIGSQWLVLPLPQTAIYPPVRPPISGGCSSSY